MTIDLQKSQKTELLVSLHEILPNISVINNIYLNPASTRGLLDLDEIIPKTGKLREQLNKYIDDQPLFEFVYEEISKKLRKNRYSKDTTPIPLSKFDDFNNISSVPNDLISQLLTLPWRYSATIKLPHSLSEILSHLPEEIEISDHMRILSGKSEHMSKFSRITGDDHADGYIYRHSALNPPPQSWEEESHYLQVFVEGYIGRYEGGAPTINISDTVKSFFGLGIALRLFSMNKNYLPKNHNLAYTIHRNMENSWKIDNNFEFDATMSSAILDLSIDDVEGHFDTVEKKASMAKSDFKKISAIISNKEKSERICLASQWYFDSVCGNNQLLSFVQAMIALEILLGDKASSEKIGLGELLRNRCAYLIGSSHAHRAEIMSNFSEIYQVRSQIVHRGKSRLTREERSLFDNLLWICRRVIQEEAKLLDADNSQKPIKPRPF